MKISILSVFPDLFKPFLSASLIGRAQKSGLVSFDLVDYRSHCAPKERIDAPTYGHDAGMLMRPEVVERAIEAQDAKHGPSFKIFLSPQGKKLDQSRAVALARKIAQQEHVTLVTARYEGIDSRVVQHYADEVISVGDVVLMGGDVPAMMLLEAVLRHLPGVVGRQESVEKESFMGPFLDAPVFAPPVTWKGYEVPEIVRSGDHAAIARWQEDEAAHKSVIGHFDWIRQSQLSAQQRQLVRKHIPAHYVALMHSEVLTRGQKGAGDTSVTSLDIHDIARSAATYDLQKYYVVTALCDQQRITEQLLDFWQTGAGITYNPQRHEAVQRVAVMPNLDEAIADLKKREGAEPIVIATSARSVEHRAVIDFGDQEKVWSLGRPVLILLGTGQGLAPSVLERSDFVLAPVRGFADFNHLSVRSAAAIIFDRWLGWQRQRSV